MSKAASLRLLCGLGLAASALVGLIGQGGTAHADKVGVAAAVNPDAFSSLSGAPQTQLNIGKSIFFNERINTTGSGLVQVLLVDGSTFTVGPGSDLVIDKFVYDPNKKTGEIAASFSKGVMRFVGGKISKNEGGVTVDTPSGALAIRGGMFQGSVNGGKGVFSFLYGVNMTLTGKNGQQFTVFQPGNTIDTTSGTPTIRPTTAGDVNAFMNALSKGGTVVTLGGSGDKTTTGTGGPKQVVYETLSLQDLISDATQTQINDQIQNQEDKGTPADTTTTPADTTTTPADTTTTPADTTTTPTDTTTTPTDTTTPPPPDTVTARVLLAPGVYTAFPGTPDEYTTDSTGDAGILGGDPRSTGDDFIWTFGFANGRLVGTVSGLTSSNCNEGDCNDIQVSNPPPADVNFPATFNTADCVNGVCAVTDATITQAGKTTTYEGLAVLKKDFFAYQLIGSPNDLSISTHAIDSGPSADPLLVFGGKGYNFGTPSGRIFAFELTPDIKEVLNGAIAPFSGGGSAPTVNPNGPQPSISPLLYLEKDRAAANDPSRAVWLQTSFYINTTPDNPGTEGNEFDQQSFVNVALGGTQDGGLVGARRGGASVDIQNFDCVSDCGTHRDQIAFTGDIATLAGPDGSHFMGKDNPNIVIGFDSTGTHNIGRDIPLDPGSSSVESQSGSTYHIGVGVGTLPAQPQTFDGLFQGYAVGLVKSEVPSSNFSNVVASTSLDDFGLIFTKTTNTLSANLTVRDVQNGDGATEAYNFGFGDNPQSPSNRSAYIDDLHYAAIEAPGATSVSFGDHSTYDSAISSAYLVSGDQLGVTQFFPDTFPADANGNRPFCTDCAFLKWGAWGARVNFGSNTNPSQFTDNIHLGWWVAGDPASAQNVGDQVSDLNKLAAEGATATYNGHVIGDVLNGSKSYVAAGDLVMNWNFAYRCGNLTISDFDNRSYQAANLGQPSLDINQFGGSLTQIDGPALAALRGDVTGSFMRGPLSPAQGVAGNFNIQAQNYRAGGIFAGSGIPVPH